MSGWLVASALPQALSGDVDKDGEIVDRFRSAVGPDIADDIDRDEQAGLALDLLRRARALRAEGRPSC